MNKKRYAFNNKGFTLVEMIVVLVILAILAAILVPALLGYIDEAKNKQDLLNAKNCLTAIQGELTKCYATQSSSLNNSNDNIIGESNIEGGNDTDICKTVFASNVKEKLDSDPYCVMFATGYYNKNITGKEKPTLHECYTICYMYYQEKEDSAPLYYYNGDWSKKNPRYGENNNKPTDILDKKDGLNYFKVGVMAGKPIRYFCVINNTAYKKSNGYTDFAKLWNKVLNNHSES